MIINEENVLEYFSVDDEIDQYERGNPFKIYRISPSRIYIQPPNRTSIYDFTYTHTQVIFDNFHRIETREGRLDYFAKQIFSDNGLKADTTSEGYMCALCRELIKRAHLENEFDDKIQAIRIRSSLSDSEEDRLRRIENYDSTPRPQRKKTTSYYRNPDIIAQKLLEANGECANCGSAPFLRRSDNTPYLEVHHIIPLSEEGEDSLENTEALCPNCHKEKHFG